MLRDQPPGIGGEEVVVIAEVEPLRVPLGVIGCQPDGDVLLRLLRLAYLVHQVDAAGPHWLPHPCGPTGSTEELALVEVELKVPVRHHPQVALTHRGKDRRDSDDVWGEMLKLDTVVEAERPHEAAWRGLLIVLKYQI